MQQVPEEGVMCQQTPGSPAEIEAEVVKYQTEGSLGQVMFKLKK